MRNNAARKTHKKAAFASALLALAMVCALLPQAVFAIGEEENQPTTSLEQIMEPEEPGSEDETEDEPDETEDEDITESEEPGEEEDETPAEETAEDDTLRQNSDVQPAGAPIVLDGLPFLPAGLNLYGAQPTKAQVEQLIADAPLYDPLNHDGTYPAIAAYEENLPKWEEPIDEEWLIAYPDWGQVYLQDSATNEMYWRLNFVGHLANISDVTVTDEDELRAALALAEAATVPMTIYVANDITVLGDPLQLANIKEEITIIGRSAAGTTITHKGTGVNFFRFDRSESAVIFKNLVLTQDRGGENSLGILTDQVDIELHGVTLRGFTSGAGSINVRSNSLKNNTLTISNCIIEDNTSTSNGGGVYSLATATTIDNTIIRNNTAAQKGGGIYSNADLTVTNSTVSGNISTGDVGNVGGGAGIYHTASIASNSLVLQNVTMQGNKVLDPHARARGGAVSVYADSAAGYTATVSITGGSISGNAGGYGGGLCMEGNITANINGASIHNNTAAQHGGGMYVGELNLPKQEQDKIDLTITDTIFSGNKANMSGGGLYFIPSKDKPANLALKNATFTQNEANQAAAAYVYLWGDTVQITDSLFKNNTGEGTGALQVVTGTDGISASTITVKNTDFVENTASTTVGGGMAVYGNATQNAEFTMDTVKFNNNTADQYGAGLYLWGHITARLNNMEFRDNTLTGGFSEGGAAIGLHDASLYNTLYVTNTAFSGNVNQNPYIYYMFDETNTTLATLHDARIHATSLSDPFSLSSAADMNKAYNGYDISIFGGKTFSTLTYVDPDGHITPPVDDTLYGNVGNYTAIVKGSSYDEVEDYRFDGWENQNDGVVYQPGDSLPMTQTTVLEALWTRIYPVTFIANADTANPPVQKLEWEEPIQEPAEPRLRGNTFIGWYMDNGTQWIFSDPSTNKMTYQKLTLTARWQPVTYNVLFEYNNGTGGKGTGSAAYGQLVTRLAQDPTYAGHTFQGWYTAASGGRLWDFATDRMDAGDLTLYAQWKANEVPPTTTPETSRNTSEGGGDSTSQSTTSVLPSTSDSSTSSGSSSNRPSTNTGGGGGGTPSAAESSSLPPDSQPEPIDTDDDGSYTILQNGNVLDHDPASDSYVQDNGTVDLFGNEVPLGGLASVGGWSVINLILCLLAIASAAVQAVRAVMKKQITRPTRLVPILTGLLPILLFAILETKTQMLLVSKWTPLVVVVCVVHIATTVLLPILGNRQTQTETAEE